MPDATTDRDRLVRYLTGDLPPASRARVEARLRRDPAFRRLHDRLQATHRFVEANAETQFAPGFADRVMDRVREEHADVQAASSLYDALQRLFLRVALACLLLIAAVGSYNAVRYQNVSTDLSVVEAAFGLPNATVQSALTSTPAPSDGM